MSKHIKPGKITEEISPYLEEIQNRFGKTNRFIFTNKLSTTDLDSIASFYKDQDVIRVDLKEFESVSVLQSTLIEEIQKEYPFKRMDQYVYLDETMERLDHYYNMKWVFILENWDSMENSEYIRFLNGIFKNGILAYGLKLVIVTGEKSLIEQGYSKFTTL